MTVRPDLTDAAVARQNELTQSAMIRSIATLGG
jgi:hypothetical protein